jgi:chromate transporter
MPASPSPVIMSAMNTPAAPAHQPVDAPTKRDLFMGFLMVGLQGFGGVLPFARRMLVEQHRWLSAREFTEVLSLSQFLPGPNIVNASIIIGNRFRGPLGSIAATLGLMLMPFVIVLILAALYARFADLEAVRGATNGVSAAATGLIIATGLKMARALKGVPWQIVMCALAFIAIALLRLPLLWVLAVLAPISIAIAWWMIPR